MKRFMISILLLCCGVGSILAQRLEIKGRVCEAAQRDGLEFANVVLQTMDSAFVTGTTTNGKGEFVMGKLHSGNYLLVVTSLGYNPQYVTLESFSKSISLGEIVLEDAAVSLDNVVVSASNQRSQSDRKVVFPSDRQVKASTNGMNLLQQLMLPKVQVNPMTNEIKVPGGGEVQLRINGVKVESQDIKALLPADIIRIEYHDNPGLRYGNAEIVLDYIVRRPETGGNFHADVMQGLNAGWGNYELSGRVNHKKSELRGWYWFGPRNFYGLSRDNEEIFNWADGKTLHRIEEGIPQHAKMFQHNMNVNYSYQEPEKYLFSASFRYWRNNSPLWNYRGSLYNVENPDDRVAMTDLKDETGDRPAIDLYYQRDMKNDQTLVFNVVGTYNGSSSLRTYQESRGDNILTDIQNNVTGKKYSIIGEAIYEKKLTNGNRIGGGLRHNHAFSDNRYQNGHDYKTNMTQAETYVYGEFKGKVRHWDYTLGLGGSRYWFHQEGEGDAYQYYHVRPKLTLQYNLPGQSFIRLNASANNSSPSLSNLNAVEQLVDSLQIERGNPNLKPYMNYAVALTYEWQKGIFYTNVWGSYEYSPDAVMDEKRLEGNKVVQTWDNQRDWKRVAGRWMLRVGPIKDIFQVSFTGGVNHYISRGNTYSHRYTNWFCEGQASVTYKKFSLMYQLMTNWNWFFGETMSGGENIQILMLNYRIKDLSIGVGALNPFADDYKVQTENRSQYASYKRAMHIQESSRLFVFNISYNFSFGRSFKSGQKRVNNSDNDSGVMNTGK